MLPRVILVGYGYWGKNIARAISKSSTLEFAGVVDSNILNLKEAEEKYQVQTFDRLQDALNRSRFDACVVATPALTHEDLTELILKNGKHVLVEKPMFIKESIGLKLSKLAQEKKLILMPGHTFLFNDSIRTAKQIVQDGLIGTVKTIYTQRLNLGQIRRDVDVFWNLAPHDISIANYILELRPKSVSAFASKITSNQFADLGYFVLHYDNNIFTHHHVSWLDPTKIRKTIIIGELGMIVVDDVKDTEKIEIHKSYLLENYNKEKKSNSFTPLLNKKTVGKPSYLSTEPLLEEVNHFGLAILKGEPQIANAEDGIEVARIINAISISIENGGKETKIIR